MSSMSRPAVMALPIARPGRRRARLAGNGADDRLTQPPDPGLLRHAQTGGEGRMAPTFAVHTCTLALETEAVGDRETAGVLNNRGVVQLTFDEGYRRGQGRLRRGGPARS